MLAKKNPDSIFVAANPFNILFDNNKNDEYKENNEDKIIRDKNKIINIKYNKICYNKYK